MARTQAMTAPCQSCGAIIGPDWKFCRFCGKEASAAVAAGTDQDLRAVLKELAAAERSERQILGMPGRPLNELQQSRIESEARAAAILNPRRGRQCDDGKGRGGGAPWALPALGAIAGAIAGFILRPALPIVGKLPLGTVVSRGSNLSGVYGLMVPAAQTSFDYLAIGTVAGLLIGVIVQSLRSA